MGWGVNLIGMSSVLDALDALTIELGTDAVYVVGSDVEYSIHQELGTRDMAPNPFLQPAKRDAERNLGRIAQQASSGDDLVRRVALYVEKRAKHYATTGVPPGPDVDTGTLRASIEAERVA